MGCFDSVFVQCPQCKRGTAEFQSKAGDCSMREFAIDDAPLVILADIDGNSARCDNCGYTMRIRVGKPMITYSE